MEVIKLRDEFIKLGQALKAANLVEDGVEAKYVIQDGEVLVNGEVDTRRGRKLYDGDVISFHGEEIKIVKQVYTCISNQQNLKITEITTHWRWNLIREPISFMGIMPKERQIYWKLHIYAVPRNPTEGVRIEK